ncbi:MAG: GPW/gp25 family protein [Planctomycetota bacterium]|jgi:phage baseplate assembly protein W
MVQNFHGRGWSFPVRVGAGGGIALAEGEENIKQAVRIIIGTVLGERAMRPGFGCGAHELVFEHTDASLTGKARFHVRNALERWEPRIEVEDVDARVEGFRLVVDVHYRVRRTNRRDNVVFPFYLQGEKP